MYKDLEKKNATKRAWYAKNKEKVKAEVRTRKLKLKEWWSEHKTGLQCSECGEDHPACLHFHHTDPSKKEMALSTAVVMGWSRERILKEANKCVVLCANCHSKLHYAGVV